MKTRSLARVALVAAVSATLGFAGTALWAEKFPSNGDTINPAPNRPNARYLFMESSRTSYDEFDARQSSLFTSQWS